MLPLPDRYDEIARAIASDDSPVGIDAKKTHVMILYLLERIDERLARLEAQAGLAPEAPPGSPPDVV